MWLSLDFYWTALVFRWSWAEPVFQLPSDFHASDCHFCLLSGPIILAIGPPDLRVVECRSLTKLMLSWQYHLGI